MVVSGLTSKTLLESPGCELRAAASPSVAILGPVSLPQASGGARSHSGFVRRMLFEVSPVKLRFYFFLPGLFFDGAGEIVTDGTLAVDTVPNTLVWPMVNRFEIDQ
jgi:hypothetical protein